MKLKDMTVEQFAKWCQQVDCKDCPLDKGLCTEGGLIPYHFCCWDAFDEIIIDWEEN